MVTEILFITFKNMITLLFIYIKEKLIMNMNFLTSVIYYLVKFYLATITQSIFRQ